MDSSRAVLLDRVPAAPAKAPRGWGDTAGTRIAHPDHLVLGRRRMTLVEGPGVDPIQKGHPALGWEGDERFALYVDRTSAEWVLVRLEADGRYRVSATTDPVAHSISAIDVVGHLIRWLVEHDCARGYDPYADVVAHNDRREAELDAAFSDRIVNDLAPRLAHALRRDGVDGWA